MSDSMQGPNETQVMAQPSMARAWEELPSAAHPQLPASHEQSFSAPSRAPVPSCPAGFSEEAGRLVSVTRRRFLFLSLGFHALMPDTEATYGATVCQVIWTLDANLMKMDVTMVKRATTLKRAVKKPAPAPIPLAKGQLWKMDDKHIEIMEVGKTLTHYRLFQSQKRGSYQSWRHCCGSGLS